MKRKIYFETMGCPKNFYDTERAIAVMRNAGYETVESHEESDIIVVNTCGFINDAKVESIDRILSFSEYAEKGKLLVVSGCLSKRYAEELFDEMPEVGVMVGVNEYDRLPELIEKYYNDGNRLCIAEETDETYLPPCKGRLVTSTPWTATLKIAEGCDNRCAYCIIPFIRGHFRSKRMEDVISEAELLASQGVKELILIAQDLTQYGMDLYGERKLAELLRKLCRIDGIRWIRIMYCYEDRITDELIDVMAEEEKIVKYIDIPIQHGSDRVLAAMKRRSTSSSIEKTLGKLRERIKDIHIRTTLIVGFPGETEEDYDILTEFVERNRFERLGVFAYSCEEGTVAGEMENQIDEDVKTERLDGIMRRQIDISLESNRKKIGQVMEVLVEEQDETDGSYIGRTQFDAPQIDNSVIFTSERELKAGDFVNVLIEDAFDYDLTGREVQ